MHTDRYLNEEISFEFRSIDSTGRSFKWLLKIPKCIQKFEKNSLRYRGAKILILFIENNVLPSKLNELSDCSFDSLVHKIRDYILSNNELTKTIFLLLLYVHLSRKKLLS